MNKSITSKSALVIAFLVLSFSVAAAAGEKLGIRNINLAGLVFNAQTLLPIEAAQIYDTDGNLLGATDKNGYYNINFNYAKTGEIYFNLRIVKKGFDDFVQQEHWGDLGDVKNIMYFGLKDSQATTKSFSAFSDNTMNNTDLSYENVIAHFGSVKATKEFNDKLEAAKTGNENVLVQIDGKFYIVDSSGWIAINSDKDLVSIDNKQVLTADKLNATIKRKNVSSMMPVDSKEVKIVIYTKDGH